MKSQKPNWTLKELNEKYLRWVDLIHETESHAIGCHCNLCLEELSLGANLELFSEDEHATAVIQDCKLVAEVIEEIKTQMEDANLEFNLPDKFAEDKNLLKAARKIMENLTNLEADVEDWIEESKENTDLFLESFQPQISKQLTLKTAEIIALRNVVDYLEKDERKDFNESEPDGQANHIYLSVEKLSKFLGRIGR